MKTNNIPLKSLLKVQLEMQKKFKFFKICVFLGPFWDLSWDLWSIMTTKYYFQKVPKNTQILKN